jgi:hypothetical protein
MVLATAWMVPGTNRGGGKRFYSLHIRPDRPWVPSSLLYCGYQGFSPLVKRPSHGVDQPPYLGLRLRKSTAIPLLPVCASMACEGATFTFPLTFTS